MIPGHSHRRAMALLLVIVAMSIVTAAATGALRASANGLTSARAAIVEAQCEALIRDLEPALVDTLREGPDSTFDRAADPSSIVFIDAAARDDLLITVGVLDLAGRLHVDHLGSFAAAGLPESLRSLRVDRSSIGSNAGMDRALPITMEEIAHADFVVHHKRHAIYPEPDENDALALWLTTRGSGALNVRTAPLPLLRAALNGRDPGAAREILDARQHGRPVPKGAIDRLSVRAHRISGAGSSRMVPLVATSDAVAFIVTIQTAGRQARCWVVLEPGPSASAPRMARSLPGLGADPAGEERPRSSSGLRWTIVERRRIE